MSELGGFPRACPPTLDIFPAADLGLTVALQRLLQLPKRLTEPEVRALAERWEGWRSYATLYLRATLDVV